MKQTTLLSPILSSVSSSITSLCRFAVHQFLSKGITIGSLTFIHQDTLEKVLFGQLPQYSIQNHQPIVNIYIHNSNAFYLRVASTADIGFAEAYMAGDFSVDHYDDLVSIFKILIANRDNSTLSTSSLFLSIVGSQFNKLIHLLHNNSEQGAVKNIEAHYDLSNELFETFLGSTWIYSCAYFNKDCRDLDQAQLHKLDMIIRKAKIQDGQSILEIGCGWGELAIHIAKQYATCKIHGITLSNEQLNLARQRAKLAQVDDRVKFELVDYREFSRDCNEKFDRIISIEMIEAVGDEYLGEYFEKIDKLLETNGLVIIQAITIPEERYERYRTSVDFIQKHIFPGGICPSLEAIMKGIYSKTKLIVEDIENIGVHYASTLKEWRRRFVNSVKEGRVEEIGFDEVFIRKWIYYLCYCEAGFSSRTLSTLQIVLTRTNNVVTLGNAPKI